MRTVSDPDLAGHLRHTIVRASRRLRQEAGSDLSPSLSAALGTIRRHGPLTPSEVAAHERIQRPTVTRILAKLEELGLIARMTDPADRRSSLVDVTEAGFAFIDEQRTRKTAFLAARLEGLSDDERAALQRAADILERILSK